MCGFIGFYSHSSSLEERKAKDALASIAHRGPDGTGLYFGANNQKMLGHVRLSIIDLNTGSQPLYNEDKSIVAVVNGELYDYQRVRKDLEAKGHQFRTQSDSEILLHLYEEYGAQAVQHLRGEFAFVLYDLKADLIFAGRDRFGIKPIFYSQFQGNYYFASEAKALFKMGVTAEWDPDTLINSLTFLTAENDKSFFKHVSQIPPAHYMLVTAHQCKVVPYWDFNYPTRSHLQISNVTEQEAIEQFKGTLHEAIRLRLHADVPVGCYLSGGLDSCSILGIASKYSHHPIHAFTLGFDKSDYDESAIAEEMARHAGAKFELIPVRFAELGNHFENAVWHAECLMFNSHGVAKFLLSDAVRKANYKVVLTGEGSDEILGGYVHFRKDMLLYNTEGQDKDTIQRLQTQLLENNKVSLGLLISDIKTSLLNRVQRTLGFAPSWLENNASAFELIKRFTNLQYKDLAGGRDVFQKFLDGFPVEQQLKGRDPVNQSLYLWSKLILPNYLLVVLGDRMEMAHSVEGRVPFLDHKVVEAATKLPVSFKIRGLTEKYALREAAKEVLTETVYKRQKHPFLAPPALLQKDNPMHTLMQDTLRSDQVSRVPFIDQKKLIDYLDGVEKLSLAEQAASDPVLTAMLSATLLAKKFHLN